MLTAADIIPDISAGPLAEWAAVAPWRITARAEEIVRSLIAGLPAADYAVAGDVACHRTARIEPGATLKGPVIVGPGCFIAAHALLRGGVWLERECSIGPGCEVKSSLLFAAARLAHFNFVGDSLIGRDANFEAGSIIANTRNEREGTVHVRFGGAVHDTGAAKFGAIVGPGARIGANAVLAPGTVLPAGAVVGRLALVDQAG